MATKYVYLTGGREVEFIDEQDTYKPEDIKQHWAATFPELSAATWDTKEVEGVKVVTFAKKVGTKGANALRRIISPGEVVILIDRIRIALEANGHRSARKFTCQSGPGMSPTARSAVILGTHENGTADSINGFWIDAEATTKATQQQADVKLVALFKEKAAR